MGSNKCVLRDLFCVRVVSKHPLGDSEDFIAVTAYNLNEGALVSPVETSHEFRVVRSRIARRVSSGCGILTRIALLALAGMVWGHS